MNNTDNDALFSGVMDIVADHGSLPVITALQILTEFESNEENNCARYREQQAWLAVALIQLLNGYQRASEVVRNLSTIVDTLPANDPGFQGIQ